MNVIQTNHPLKWRLKNYHNYCWSEDKILFNTKTGKRKKQCYNGGMIGYWIDRKFISLQKLRTEIELIPKIKLPF